MQNCQIFKIIGFKNVGFKNIVHFKNVVHGLDTSAQGNFPQISQISHNHPPIVYYHIIRITSIRWSGHCQQVGCKRLQYTQ